MIASVFYNYLVYYITTEKISLLPAIAWKMVSGNTWFASNHVILKCLRHGTTYNNTTCFENHLRQYQVINNYEWSCLPILSTSHKKLKSFL